MGPIPKGQDVTVMIQCITTLYYPYKISTCALVYLCIFVLFNAPI